jgi:hypothetical protein
MQDHLTLGGVQILSWRCDGKWNRQKEGDTDAAQ